MSPNLPLVGADNQSVPLPIENPHDSCSPSPNFDNVAPIVPQSQDFSFDSAHNHEPQPSSAPSSPQKLSELMESGALDDSSDKGESQRMILKFPMVSSVVFGTKNGSFNATLCTMKKCDTTPSASCNGNNDGRKPCMLTNGETTLRRSPRLISSSMDNNTPNMLVKGSDAKTKSISNSRNSLKSRRSCHIEVDSDSKILSDAFDEQPYKRIKKVADNSDLGISDTELFIHPQEKKEDHCCNSEKINRLSCEKKQKKEEIFCSMIGDPLPVDEAQERWRWRYEMKNEMSTRKLLLDDDGEDKIVWNVECHYSKAQINGYIFKLGDCAYIKGDGDKKHVGRIIEFFKTTDGEDYFRVQWFYRVEDTVIQDQGAFHDKKRLFYSTVMNDNPIDCIISKVSVVQISPWISSKRHLISPSGFYFDMEYSVDYSSFRTMHIDEFKKNKSSPSPEVVEPVPGLYISSLEQRIRSALAPVTPNNNLFESCISYKAELSLLDIFSGCGGMSTGLCLGAKVSSVNLVTRWALDSDKSACESFKLNHPETHVRNEGAEDFLQLLKQWEKLCKKYALCDTNSMPYSSSMALGDTQKILDFPEDGGDSPKDDGDSPEDDEAPGEYEVSRVVDVCYGDPDETGSHGLKFKVHWKGYSSSEDTWEPAENLRNCEECIRDFVRCGFKSKILPLPGDVDVICGGPPCQGISGYNRFRNVDSPLSDERNRQIIVFLDIVQFLKPKFVLMENVVDIIKLDKASLARYALSRLVHMKYQARLGTMAAGCYGLPQFRLRIFVWGAHPSEKLPQFPLPTHDVIVRYYPPSEFERNTVAYDENQPRELEKAAVLKDAISDLPPVRSHENHEELTYEKPPETEFQRFIRSTIHEMTGTSHGSVTNTKSLLYDHRTYSLTEDDYTRLCMIPKKKGANFRDLPGVVVGSDNVVRRDPTMQQEFLPSGKPLVPDYAFTFEHGKSKRPYGRLWWDETVSTIVTFPNLCNQVVIHPEQDRVLTIRECARLQGFPDYYRFSGSVKERYRQIGNAVAVPVGRALGYALGMAFQKLGGDEPLIKLPPKFAYSTNLQLAKSLSHKTNSLVKLTPALSHLSDPESARYKKAEEECGQ